MKLHSLQGVTAEIVLPAEQTCSLGGSEKCWLSPCCALPPLVVPCALGGSEQVLLLQELCVKLLLYQLVDTGELCRYHLKSPDRDDVARK